MNKFWIIVTIWIALFFAYIIIGFIMPVVQDITADTAVELQATSNMSNYPGTLEAVRTVPLLAWFIPGVIGIVATVVVLKTDVERW